MDDQKWTEIRREFNTTERGVLEPTRIVYERDKSSEFSLKDKVDIIFRIITATAIAIPIFIFIAQQKTEIKKQKELFKFNVFTNASSAFHGMLETKPGSKEYDNFRSELFYNLYPKLLLISDSETIRTYNEFRDHILVNEYGIKSSDRIASAQNVIIYGVNKLLDSVSIIRKKDRLKNLFNTFHNQLDQELQLLYEIRQFLTEHEFEQSNSKDSLKFFTENTDHNLDFKIEHIHVNRDFYAIENIDSVKRIDPTVWVPHIIAYDSTLEFNQLTNTFDHFFKRNSKLLMHRFDSLIKTRSSYLYE